MHAVLTLRLTGCDLLTYQFGHLQDDVSLRDVVLSRPQQNVFVTLRAEAVVIQRSAVAAVRHQVVI